MPGVWWVASPCYPGVCRVCRARSSGDNVSTDNGPRPLPDPCCQGAVVLTSQGMALHGYGTVCQGPCVMNKTYLARYDAPSNMHLCPRCDPTHKAYRLIGRAERA